MDFATGYATHDRSDVTPELNSSAAAYLDVLSREQASFLDATMEARRRFGIGAGQLTAVAALHGRLTQQFFDAQRSLLRRRAENDSRVRSIGEAIDAETDAMLEAARESAVTRSVSRSVGGALPEFAVDTGVCRDVSDVDDAHSARQQIADLVASMVRSGDEAHAFAAAINDAFVPDEPHGASAQRQLQEVLDAWWQSEKQENRAAIDDATARAAMRLHVAKLEAAELAGFDVVEPFDAGQFSVDVAPECEAHVTRGPAMEPAAAAVDPEREPNPDGDIEPEPDTEIEPDIEFEPAAAGIELFDEADVDGEPTSDEQASDGPVDVDQSTHDESSHVELPLEQPTRGELNVNDEPGCDEPADDLERSHPSHAVTPTSMSLLEALDHTDHVGLDAVLELLLDAPHERADEAVAVISIEAQRDVVFDRFWAGPVVAKPSMPPRRWVSTQVMVPAAAIVGLGAVVLAWMG